MDILKEYMDEHQQAFYTWIEEHCRKGGKTNYVMRMPSYDFDALWINWEKGLVT